MTSWTVTVEFTDHGIWDPANEAACRGVIAAVNHARTEDDHRPRIRRDYEGEPFLNVAIGGEEFNLYPGEHLVSGVMPNGHVHWSTAEPETLETLGRPA